MDKYQYKYYLTRPGESESEVSEIDYVVAERGEGYSNTMGDNSKPATSAFKGRHVTGRMVQVHVPNEGN